MSDEPIPLGDGSYLVHFEPGPPSTRWAAVNENGSTTFSPLVAVVNKILQAVHVQHDQTRELELGEMCPQCTEIVDQLFTILEKVVPPSTLLGELRT